LQPAAATLRGNTRSPLPLHEPCAQRGASVAVVWHPGRSRLHGAGRSARNGFLFQTQCDSRELFRYLLRDLGLTPGPDLASMHEQLNQVMLEEARAGRRVVVVIDEAQNLKGSVLETVRLLSDFETSQRKLLQIILAGQSEFVSTLMRPEMEQLKQRIAMLSYLPPLNRQETGEYIAHRLQMAGYQGGALFTSEALEIIARGSGGIPRNINNLCFN